MIVDVLCGISELRDAIVLRHLPQPVLSKGMDHGM